MTETLQIVGVDLDNTLVCYDELFHALACERQLIPPELPITKLAVRDYLRRTGAEARWTELQGSAYGARMNRAIAFADATAVLQALRVGGTRVVVVSHRTRTPYAGEPADLHQTARAWLQQAGFLTPGGVGLADGDVFLEATQEEKCRRIAALGCDVFIDDLPEVFAHTAFPPSTRRILFDPRDEHGDHALLERSKTWREIAGRLQVGFPGECR